jgi:hypothetical protein
MQDYWEPLWKASYKPEDCNVDKVMDSLDIDRRTPGKATGSASAAAGAGVMPTNVDYYDEDEGVDKAPEEGNKA